MKPSDRTGSHRRDFLLGRSFWEHLIGNHPAGRVPDRACQAETSSPENGLPNPLPNPRSDQPACQAEDRFEQQRRQALPSHYWEQFSKRAMACPFEILLNLHQYSQGAMVVGEAFELIDQLEEQLTIYRGDSEISRLNSLASEQPIRVESRLFELLNTGVQLFRETGGAFDITAGALSEAWGFTRRSGELPERRLIESILVSVGSDRLLLDAEQQTVRYLHPQLKINLGGIGKGYALDRVGELLISRGVADFICHGGQSSVIAGGNDLTDTESPGSGWAVGLSHPVLPQLRLGEIRLVNQALGTSGSARQNFYSQGKQFGHIIDPRTGWPAARFLSTTVLAPSAAQADALATAFYLMPVEQISEYCRQHSQVTAILLSNPQQQDQQPLVNSELLMQTFNLNANQLKLLGSPQ
jgi:thiamine biosynthesis lipoprotein